MGFLTYSDPLVYDNEEVLHLVGEEVYNQMNSIDFDERFKNGGAYKDGVYHGISYRYLYWTLIKDINFLTIVLENEVNYIRSDHVHNLEMDRPWTSTEVYAITGGIAGAVCVVTVAVTLGAVVLVPAMSSAAAGASASAVSSISKPQNNPIDFPETHARTFEARRMYKNLDMNKEQREQCKRDHMEYVAEYQPAVYNQLQEPASSSSDDDEPDYE